MEAAVESQPLATSFNRNHVRVLWVGKESGDVRTGEQGRGGEPGCSSSPDTPPIGLSLICVIEKSASGLTHPPFIPSAGFHSDYFLKRSFWF